MLNKFWMLTAFILALSCNDNSKLECLPRVTVNYQEFIPPGSLHSEVGSTFTVSAGIKNIVVYVSQVGVYKAYDLQAPHLCTGDKCARLTINNTLLEGCDGSVFALANGAPIKVSNRGLLQYNTVFQNNTLIITSY